MDKNKCPFFKRGFRLLKKVTEILIVNIML